MSNVAEDHTPKRQDAKTPSRTKIKICGVRDVETAHIAAAAGADLIGLNFVEKSPRYVTAEQAKSITAALPAGVEAVGLFSDNSLEQVRQTAESAGVQTVQLHGREDPDFAHQLGGLRIIKALGFAAESLHEKLAPWREAAESLSALLIDTPPSADAAITGGSGESFDWETLARLLTDGLFQGLPPLMLAGGLTHGTVGEAIRTVRPWAVDVSSGVESSRGVKDPAMIADFCTAVRAADAELYGA